MRPNIVTTGGEPALAALAERQYGVVTRAQVLALGFSSPAIARRLRTGRLHGLHAGVYAVGHTAPRAEARWLAAVLACGEGALLSHRSAAALWRIRSGEGPAPDVIVPTKGGRARPGIRIHRAAIDPADARVRSRIPVTSPERTLADLAREVDGDELARALREAQFLRIFDLSAMHELLARRPCRPLAALVEDPALTRSHLEDRLLRICDRHGIERPVTQEPILGHRVDFCWPQARIVVETDGWESHGTRTAFQADRSISNALQLAGYRILRFTNADLKRRPAQVAGQIRAALAGARG